MRQVTLGSLVVVCLALFGRVPPADAGSWLFVSLLNRKQIVTFERDPETGTLVRRWMMDCPAEPACMSCSPDQKTLFVSLRSTGQLASFHLDGQSGRLRLSSVVEGGADPAFLLPDRTGRFLLTAYYQANKVTVHRLAPDGSISGEPVQTIPTAEKAHGVALDSTNRFAFVTHTAANKIFQFRFDPQTGLLTPNDPPFIATAEADQPRHIVLHPSDRWAYTSNEAGDSLGVYAVNPETRALRSLQTLPTIPADFDGAANATARCEMTPDGRFVYVANRGHDSIACFAVNQETGLATHLGNVATEKTPRSFTIDPRGKFLYVAGQSSGRVAAHRIENDGMLSRLAVYESGPVSWWALAVDAD